MSAFSPHANSLLKRSPLTNRVFVNTRHIPGPFKQLNISKLISSRNARQYYLGLSNYLHLQNSLAVSDGLVLYITILSVLSLLPNEGQHLRIQYQIPH